MRVANEIVGERVGLVDPLTDFIVVLRVQGDQIPNELLSEARIALGHRAAHQSLRPAPRCCLTSNQDELVAVDPAEELDLGRPLQRVENVSRTRPPLSRQYIGRRLVTILASKPQPGPSDVSDGEAGDRCRVPGRVLLAAVAGTEVIAGLDQASDPLVFLLPKRTLLSEVIRQVKNDRVVCVLAEDRRQVLGDVARVGTQRCDQAKDEFRTLGTDGLGGFSWLSGRIFVGSHHPSFQYLRWWFGDPRRGGAKVHTGPRLRWGRRSQPRGHGKRWVSSRAATSTLTPARSSSVARECRAA
jgi:hypothetical protein